ncbi:SAF domain-containing protein [Solirubrobacter phytolaccae]|uniref:SAF domain-containing protein n=1 Tax=Solirubrobacter phytolaccae TaxID=1404360 RepID=A0A9X3N9P6_9ACTN|nr:SAF domain-containing protein [Solirubrobacter phytolaccae]MDA0182011.1 SAF domain-containing protein [Solirubrobacter phytolaccae]
MTRRRRATVLLALALVLGALSATHMSRREAALEAQLGPLTEVVVARTDLPAGRTLQLADLGVRALPARYAPAGEPVFAAALAGRKLAVPVVAGGAVTAELIARDPEEPPVKRGERAVDVVASGNVTAGARVDVVVTTDKQTRLALQAVEVLAAKPAAAKEGGGPRVAATLRVPVTDAVYLVAAQEYARDVRLLARIPGDERTVDALTVGDGL